MDKVRSTWFDGVGAILNEGEEEEEGGAFLEQSADLIRKNLLTAANDDDVTSGLAGLASRLLDLSAVG